MLLFLSLATICCHAQKPLEERLIWNYDDPGSGTRMTPGRTTNGFTRINGMVFRQSDFKWANGKPVIPPDYRKINGTMFDALRSTNFVTLSGKVEQVLSTHMVVIDGSVWMSHTTSHIVLKEVYRGRMFLTNYPTGDLSDGKSVEILAAPAGNLQKLKTDGSMGTHPLYDYGIKPVAPGK